jgi:carboxymethylenebutenolidase
VPVVVHFGRYDQGIPMEKVEPFIARAPANAEVHVYDAGHGFNSDRRKDYHEPSAELARTRTLALFKSNGG